MKSKYKKAGKAIRAKRLKMRLNQAELAKILKLGRTSVTNLELGNQEILFRTALIIAKKLKINVITEALK